MVIRRVPVRTSMVRGSARVEECHAAVTPSPAMNLRSLISNCSMAFLMPL
jgi:hypothetical protein